jgi:ABC-type uncharacterized transport system substrate-binding protein
MALLLDTAGDWDDVQAVQQVATSIGVKLIVIEAQGKWDRAFGSALTEHAQALLVGAGPNLYRQRSRIIELASKHRLPAIYEWGDAVKEGGLMAYGPDFAALYPRIASYIDRIFKGTSPTEMPIEEPTKFEFVINLKTAKALGLTIPQSLLGRADEVIQ